MSIDLDFLIAFCIGATAAWAATAGYHMAKMNEKQIEIDKLIYDNNTSFLRRERMLEYREDEG